MKSDLLRQIQGQMPHFSKSQKAVALYLTEHYEKAAYMTASKLGECAGVSESTVVRFACELGYSGYPELQEMLRELVRTRLTSVQRLKITNDRIGDQSVPVRVLEDDINRIRQTLEGIDRERFQSAVQAICRGKTIYVAGVRATASLASFFYFNCSLIFPNVKLITSTSGNEILEQMLHITKDDVMVAFSFPRYSRQMVNAVRYADSNGAYVVALTDSEEAPIARYADCLLTAKSDMVSYIDSLVAPLSLINALIVAIAKEKENELPEALGKLEKIWETYEVYDNEHD